MANNNDFASSLVSGFMGTYVPLAQLNSNNQKLALDQKQLDLLNTYRQDQLAESRQAHQFTQTKAIADAVDTYATQLHEWQKTRALLGDQLAGPPPAKPFILGGTDFSGSQGQGGFNYNLPDASGAGAPPSYAQPGKSPYAPVASGASSSSKPYSGLGDIIFKAESGGDPGMVAPDAGGFSYGLNQINYSPKVGNTTALPKFINDYGYAPWFTDAPGTPTFNAQWKAYGQSNPDFAKAQRDFASKEFLKPVADYAASRGIDTNNPGIQEALLGLGNAHGPEKAKQILDRVATANPNGITSPMQFLSALYQERMKPGDNGATLAYWRSSDPATQAAVKNRLAGERDQILSLAGQGGQQGTGFAPGTMYAQNGSQVVSDASGAIRPDPKDPLGWWLKQPPEVFAKLLIAQPKNAEMLKAMYSKANPDNANQIIERDDGTFLVNKATGQYRKIEGLPGKGNGAAFGGQGMDNQSWSSLISLKDKIANGTASPEERNRYAAAEMHLSAPRISTDPVTGAQTIIQPDITQAGFPSLRQQQGQAPLPQGQTQPNQNQTQAPPTAQGTNGTGYTWTQTSGPKQLTAESATKASAMQNALKAIDGLTNTLIQGGQYQRGLVLKSDIPLIGALPFSTEAKQTGTNVTFAIEAILRGLSGAGVPETEVQRYRAMLAPSATDTAESFKTKMDLASGILRDALDKMGVQQQQGASGGWNGQSAPQQSASDPLGLR